MKKLIILVSLVMGFVFANAQVQYDTITHINEITIKPNAVVLDSTNEQYDIVTIYDSSIESGPLYSSSTIISFYADGLDSNDYIVLYVNDWTISHQVVGYDTVFTCDTFYSDVIDRIDTVLIGHPGVIRYDTVYLIEYIDTIDITRKTKLFPIFSNGYNNCVLDDYIGDSVCIDNISIFVLNDEIGDSVGENDVNIYDIYLIVQCENLNINGVLSNIRMYPNPTSNIIYLEGFYETLIIHDTKGRVLARLINNQANSFDMSQLKSGEYFFNFDGYHTIKVIKK